MGAIISSTGQSRQVPIFQKVEQSPCTSRLLIVVLSWQLLRLAGKISKESFAVRSVNVNAQSPGKMFLLMVNQTDDLVHSYEESASEIQNTI